VSFENFNRLMQSLLALAPPALALKKHAFLERANKFFSPASAVTLHELEILLSDEFMLEMSLLIAVEAKDIVSKTLQAYQEGKAKEETKAEDSSKGTDC
jgi:hypothetical protein